MQTLHTEQGEEYQTVSWRPTGNTSVKVKRQ